MGAVAALCLIAAPPSAFGHGEKGEMYVPWTDKLTEQRAIKAFSGKSSNRMTAAQEPLGTSNLALVGNSDKDGVVNSDLAFWGNLAYAGNYGGFRILDITTDVPQVISDVACNGPQNDVSVHELAGRRYLFQSIDTAQTSEGCDSANAPIVDGVGRVGYEGIRVFDVTDPANPQFLEMIQTACGSHTHTLIPDGDNRAYIYVSSYPLGTNITPPGAEGPGDWKACELPHKKISIIEVTGGSAFSWRLKEQPLSDDTAFNRGFQACHDVQVYMPTKVAIGSCAGDAQLWDVSNPWKPTTDVEGKHTHIYSPSASDQFEFIHSGVVTWDGKYFAIMDETGGGGTANCFGSQSTDGFYYFYKMVKPGKRIGKPISRYMIPRDQGEEICVSHNASVIPVAKRYVMSASYYQGGVTVVDFTNVSKPREIAYADLEDGIGDSDEWSSYWYNGRIFSNGGLNRRDGSNRGLDVFRPAASLGLSGAKTWWRSNPQTQEAWQAP